MWVQSLGWEDPLEEGMAIHSSILAWRIPWTDEPGGLQSRGSHRVKTELSDWPTPHTHKHTHTHTHTHTHIQCLEQWFKVTLFSHATLGCLWGKEELTWLERDIISFIKIRISALISSNKPSCVTGTEGYYSWLKDTTWTFKSPAKQGSASESKTGTSRTQTPLQMLTWTFRATQDYSYTLKYVHCLPQYQ